MVSELKKILEYKVCCSKFQEGKNIYGCNFQQGWKCHLGVETLVEIFSRGKIYIDRSILQDLAQTLSEALQEDLQLYRSNDTYGRKFKKG